MTTHEAAVEWLLASSEPAIRFLTHRDILDEPTAEDVTAGAMVSALLSGQASDGGFGKDPYRKWTGAHWRLVSLVELAIPAADPRAHAAANHVLDWLVYDGPIASVPLQGGRLGTPATIGALPLVHAAVHGYALGASCRLGLANDPRVHALATALVAWQWPDGGWNCDVKASGRRSSFHETLPTAWGLHEFSQATGDRAAEVAAERAAELFLGHRLLYRLGTDRVIRPRWLELRYPSYWHYDMLQVLLLLARMGRLGDHRAAAALDELQRRQRPDGRWIADGRWWNAPSSTTTPDIVNWGEPGEPNEMITLNALRILRTAGRL